MIDLRVLLIAVAVALAGGFAGGYTVRGWYDDSLELAIKKVRDDAMDGAADAIAKIEVKNTTIYQTATTKIIERQVYQECKHEQDMLDQINATLVPPP